MAGNIIWRGPNIVKDGLVLYLDSGSPNSFYSPTAGTTWKDISGNNINGTLTNGPIYNSNNNGSLTFDGIDDYVQIPYNSNIDLNFYTACIWVKVLSTNTDIAGVFYREIGPSEKISYFLDYGLNRSNFFCAGSYATGQPQNVFSTTTYTSRINLWTHIAFYRDANYKVGIYVNGVKENETTFLSYDFTNNIATAYVGRGGQALQRYSNSNVARIELYNRALSESEILQNYNVTKSRYL